MNKYDLYVVKEIQFVNPFITDIDSILDNCFKDCHHKYFHNFKYESVNDINYTNITNNEIFELAISSKSMTLYELNKRLKIAKQNGFLFNHTNKLAMKFYSHLRYKNKNFYLKLQIPMCQRQSFGVISQNQESLENFCNDMVNPFRFACQKWFNQLN